MKKIEGLLNCIEINRMVGRGGSALPVFRHCFTDFPDPAMVNKDRALYFKREEVIAWFEKHGVKYNKEI